MWLQSIFRPLLAVALVSILGVDASSQGRGPLSTIQVIDSPVIKTPSHRVHSHSDFDLEFVIKDRNQRVRLVLEPNHDIIPEDAGVSILGPDGSVVAWEPIDRRSHRIFRGSTWVERSQDVWDNQGWSRINIIKDGAEPLFEGSFSIMHDSHHIQLRHKFQRTMIAEDPSIDSAGEGPMILFRDSDTATHPWHGDLKKREQAAMACPADQLEFNSNPFHPVHMSFTDGFEMNMGNATLERRQSIDGGSTSGNAGSVNYASTIGSTQGCPTSRKVALVGVAADCEYRSLIGDRNTTQSHIIGVINQASQVYEQTFNITLALRNLTITDPDCPTTAPANTPWNMGCGSFNMSSRLNAFSTWRGQYQDVNAYWMLLTNCPSGAEVGLSWLGQLCVNSVTTVGGQSTSGANVVAHTSTEWQVIAHETGHMFGAVHDCDSTTCASTAANAQQCCPLSTSSCNANAQFIMNPSTGTNIQAFSACTVGNICSAMYRKSVTNTCLVDNKGVSLLVTGQQCGNGIVEEGEECDCGGTAGCVGNTCCDPTTCKFINNAVCDDSNEQCCRGCQFASNGTVCRASTGVCDPQEVCSGNNATCPSDTTAPNGQSCGNNLQCASGQCTSRDLQCKSLMGSLTTNNDTYACDSESCTLLCASPQFPKNQCYSMQQYFLDGTPCGSGTCQNGVCSGSSTAGDIAQFFQSPQNQTIIIAVCSSVGGLLVLCILGCCVRRYRRRSKRKAAYAQRKAAAAAAGSNMQQQWPAPTGTWAPPPPRFGGALSQDSPHLHPGPEANGYFAQQRHNYPAPTTPGAVHDARGSGANQDGRQPMFYGGHSVRYA